MQRLGRSSAHVVAASQRGHYLAVVVFGASAVEAVAFGAEEVACAVVGFFALFLVVFFLAVLVGVVEVLVMSDVPGTQRRTYIVARIFTLISGVTYRMEGVCKLQSDSRAQAKRSYI